MKGERVHDDGAAAGSRAVLSIAIVFFVVCMAQAVMTVMDNQTLTGPLAEEHKAE
ncbi:MAG: hypothetical protein AAGF88_08725 [Pseudomonadota bacterium]